MTIGECECGCPRCGSGGSEAAKLAEIRELFWRRGWTDNHQTAEKVVSAARYGQREVIKSISWRFFDDNRGALNSHIYRDICAILFDR